MQQLLILVALLAITLSTTVLAGAQDDALVYAPSSDESANYQSEVVLQQLDNPTGLVVREGPVSTGPHELFIAESGAGKIVRVSTQQPDEVREAITGFPISSFGTDPSYRAGPIGLTLLTRTKLAVGSSGQDIGKNVVGVYSLPIGGSTIAAEAADHTAGPLTEKDMAKVGHDQLIDMAKTDLSLFVVAGDEQSSWILKSDIEANRLTSLKPFVPTDKSNPISAASCIAVTPRVRPTFLVVGQSGSKEVANDSSITFVVPTSGMIALHLDTGLHDLSGLAYSPKGNLYAVDTAWQDDQSGGVYRLDDAQVEGKQACRAVKIASVAKPTALAFTPNGELYVTTFGPTVDDKQGTLVKITGEF